MKQHEPFPFSACGVGFIGNQRAKESLGSVRRRAEDWGRRNGFPCTTAHNVCDGICRRIKSTGKFPPMMPRAGGMGSATASHLQLSIDLLQLPSQIIRGHGLGAG